MNPLDLWSGINWLQVEKWVNKLRFRITKAMKRGAHHLVKRLQYLLKNSFYAKLIAIKRVTTNKGRRTSGVDRKLWKTPASKWKAALSLSSKGFKSKPLRRVFIEKKGKKKKRPLGIPTMYDRAMQALHALTLEPLSEFTADKRSFGFRKYRSCHDAGAQIFNCLSSPNSAEWVLEGDIKGCFDNISHEWLMNNIPMDKKVLKEFLTSGFSFKGNLFPTKEGTPQGGIISPILANMALDGIEEMLMMKYWSSSTGKIHKQHNKQKVNFIRYADDFIITAKTKDIALEVQDTIEKFLSMRGLVLSQEKTSVTHIADGFDFLGWNVKKWKGKLLIRPSKDSCKSIADKIRTVIKTGKTLPQDTLIKVLNPIIRGWCNYHRSMVSKEKFRQLDSILFTSLWKWSRRRHPMKSRQWIKDKYFRRMGTRDWTFHGEKERIIFASDTKIKRHRMIQLDRNPFSKQDQDYFLSRRRFRKVQSLQLLPSRLMSGSR